MNLFDVVILAEDHEDLGLAAGAQGTIVDVYDEPRRAYEVEFLNDDGETVALATLEPDEVREE